jgi:hypothetical protein
MGESTKETDWLGTLSKGGQGLEISSLDQQMGAYIENLEYVDVGAS